MCYRVRELKSVLLLAALLFVAVPQSFAQSQYRRSGNKDKQTNSVYKPDNNKGSKPQSGKKPPLINQGRPGQNNRPSQSGPVQNRPKPNGPATHKPAQPVHKPAPGRPAPPPGHNRPTPPPTRPGGFAPRPSVHHYYGYYVNTLPFGARVIHRGPYTYYYASGRYYRFVDNRYVVCRPPVGAVIAKTFIDGIIDLVAYSVRDSYGRTHRYYTDGDGVYYLKSGSNYIVVDPPVGAIVYELPYGYEEVTINGARYYRVDDTIYDIVYNGPQDYYFRVVGSIN